MKRWAVTSVWERQVCVFPVSSARAGIAGIAIMAATKRPAASLFAGALDDGGEVSSGAWDAEGLA
jgi:hypothetical protein